MNLKTIISIALILFALTAIMFCYQITNIFDSNSPIDSNRFSHFGSFISGFFGFINFILLVFSLRESKLQTFESAFFSQLQIHDGIAKDLKSNHLILSSINDSDYFKLFKDYMCENIRDEELRKECVSYRELPSANDTFEALYRKLHIRYKYKNDSLGDIFKDEKWRIGHFLRSFISLVEFIQTNNVADIKRKKMYANILQSRSSSDEIRIIFYYLISSPNENMRTLELFKSLDFFKGHLDSLVFPSDWEKYENA